MNSHKETLKYLECAINGWEEEKNNLDYFEEYPGNIAEYLTAVDNEIFWGKLLKSSLEAVETGELEDEIPYIELKEYVDIYLTDKTGYDRSGKSLNGP